MAIKIKASTPKGMRDFLPDVVAKRQYIMDTIKGVFVKFGFQEIYTPVMENLNTLTGKYGEEGDKLLFKVLNSGDYLSKVDETLLQEKNSRKTTAKISEKGLRYDLTVPLARYVVQHQNDLVFPFKRFHIAPVWRADRPQKGRYREFYQCDADVIGSPSIYNEVELVQIYAEVFETLGLDVTIKYNNRKILVGLMQAIGLEGKETAAITSLDKLDKIGLEKVLAEIAALGVSDENITLLKKAIETNSVAHLPSSELIETGKKELALIQKNATNNAKFDITLARGLDYYTGCIFEVVSNEYEIGSIGGGGRYDNLTEMFGKKDLTGVGISFGLDRIYDVIDGLDKFPAALQQSSTQILFTHFDSEAQDFAFEKINTLRKNGIAAEVYPDIAKMKKQMKYANEKNIAFVCVIGSQEMETGNLTLKNMTTGEQTACSFEEMISLLKNLKT